MNWLWLYPTTSIAPLMAYTTKKMIGMTSLTMQQVQVLIFTITLPVTGNSTQESKMERRTGTMADMSDMLTAQTSLKTSNKYLKRFISKLVSALRSLMTIDWTFPDIWIASMMEFIIFLINGTGIPTSLIWMELTFTITRTKYPATGTLMTESKMAHMIGTMVDMPGMISMKIWLRKSKLGQILISSLKLIYGPLKVKAATSI